MSARLPVPGGDDGDWGIILNDFLEVSLNNDGTLQSNAVKQAGAEVTTNKGAASGYASLDASGLVPSNQLGTGAASSSNYLRGDGTWVTPNGGSSSLASDSDVAIVSPANNQILTFNSVSGKWENLSPAVISVAGKTGVVALAEGDITNLTTDLSSKLTASNNLSDVSSATTARSNLAAAASLVPTTIQTAAYTPAVNDLAKFDISGGSVTTQTLPSAPPDKSLYAAKIIKTSGTNTVVLNTQGSDVINVSGGSTTYTLKLLNQSVMFQYQATGNIWNILSDDLPLSQLDSRYSLAGTTAVITDGITQGGTITVGTTTPPSPGPRDFWVDPAVSPQASDISGVVAVSTVAAAGDLIVGTGSAAIERLPIGSPGQVLTIGGSDPSGLEWAPASLSGVVRGLYLKSSAAVTPSTTLGTYGTTQSVGLDSSTTSMVPFGILYTPTGVGSESITLQATATYQDASTASGSVTVTTNTNASFSATNLSGMWQDGKYITSIGFHAKSTINSSTASFAITVFGIST